MKKHIIPGFFMITMVFMINPLAHSQCEPDLENCIDVNEPGQICPEELANGNVAAAYEENITVLTPGVVKIVDTEIEILKLTLDSIHNLPPGLDFSGESLEFVANEAYCVSIAGTPTTAGTYFLKIYVTPYIDFFGSELSLGAQVDSTSVSVTIEPSLGIYSLEKDGFSLIYAYPNPFMTATRIGYLEPSQGVAELRVMNMLGKEIYAEKIMAVQGENYFHFKGDDLPPGYYIYAILRDQKSLKGKLLKRK